MSLAPVSLAGIHTTTERSTTRLELPFLAKEGAKREPDRAKHQEMLRPLRKCCAASLAGADGVVGSSHRLSVVEQTTPAAPSKEGAHFLDGASSPPWPRRGVLFALCLFAANVFAQGPRGGPPRAPKDAAPFDMTGYWVAVVS